MMKRRNIYERGRMAPLLGFCRRGGKGASEQKTYVLHKLLHMQVKKQEVSLNKEKN